MFQAMLRRIETNDETLKQFRVNLGSERELRQFITAVPENSNIHDLSIEGIGFAPEVATALSAIIPRMPILGDFALHDCDCSNADGLSILASALANRASLELLLLRNCRLGSFGAEVIASSFGENATLKKLIIERNSIGNQGAIAFASLFASNSSITDVSLMNNNIGSDGMSTLAASVRENRSVESIVLHANSDKPDKHFKPVLYNDASIESVIASNHTLESIYPQTSELRSLLELNWYGPEHAVQSKIIRFLNEQPTFALTMGLKRSVMPSYVEKIGRNCRLNTMFELIRNVPGLLEEHRRHPEQPSRKRSRS